MENIITREAAWELLRKYNKDPFHLQHALTVEVSLLLLVILPTWAVYKFTKKNKEQ